MAAVAELEYRPSAVARALVSGYSKTIALLVADIANPFYPQLAKSVEREARQQGYAMVICDTGDDPRESAALFRRLVDQGVDGMVYASVGVDEEEVLSIIGDPRRIVFVNRRPQSTRVSYVVNDNRAAAALLIRHFVDAGHRRIGFVSGPSWAANARERLVGIQAAANQHGVDVVVAEGDFRIESGAAAMISWLESGSPPSAVIGVSDEVAIGVLGVLAKRSGGVPQIAVGGFDDTDLASSDIISLTSVAQHIEEMGQKGVRLLVDQLAYRSHPPAHEILQPDLHVRRTSLNWLPAAPSSGPDGSATG